MRKLGVFNFVTLNGFYKGPNNDISWHKHGAGGEEAQFADEGAQSGGVLLFGRVTYEMMVAFWPTEQAYQTFPLVADGMNKAEKIVFSNTLKNADWNNTRVIGGDIVAAVRKMKQEPGKDLTILGSGSIVSILADHGLIDSFQFMVDPIALGAGTPVFNNISKPLQLELVSSKAFKSGTLILTYRSKKTGI